MNVLQGKNCLVTGAAGVVGEAISRRFAAMGCRLVLVDVQAQPIAALAEELGGTALPMDISSETAVAEGLATLDAGVREIDILVDNPRRPHQ